MLQKLLDRFPPRLRALAERLNPSPIDDIATLTEFAQTRAAFIAQTSLFGYLKTRMGTRFPEYFEDATFSRSIREASVKLFVSCLGDLSVFTTATVGQENRLSADEAALLARYCFSGGLERALEQIDTDHVPHGAVEAFDERTSNTQWANAAIGTHAFSGSEGDLIRYAPVVDEFKQLDREIVTNSIRFRWNEIRDQARKRIDRDAVCASWQAYRVSTE